MRVFRRVIKVLFAFVITYFIMLEPASAQLSAKIKNDTIIKDLSRLEAEVNSSEAARTTIKKDNEAKIVWADPNKKEKTEYVLVYLHGFSASWMEGYPVNFDFAKRYGCNMYLARLYGHGIDTTDALVNLTPENYLESAKKAVSIGRQLGDKVILMSTSTGGTLSLAIAAENPWIYGLILYSPNIDVADKSANMLTKPCGLCIGKIFHGKYMTYDDPPEVQKYWQSKYRLEAVRAMKRLVNKTMKEKTFVEIHEPLFLGYYYKDEENQDPTVSVPRMLEMFNQISTPETEKRKVAFPKAGVHPIASGILSKDVKGVEKATFKFAEEVLGMKPVND